MTDNWKGEHHIRVTPDPYASRGMNIKNLTPKHHKTVTTETIARREKVSKLVRQGDSVSRIATKLGIKYHLVYFDCKAMNLLNGGAVQ